MLEVQLLLTDEPACPDSKNGEGFTQMSHVRCLHRLVCVPRVMRCTKALRCDDACHADNAQASAQSEHSQAWLSHTRPRCTQCNTLEAPDTNVAVPPFSTNLLRHVYASLTSFVARAAGALQAAQPPHPLHAARDACLSPTGFGRCSSCANTASSSGTSCCCSDSCSASLASGVAVALASVEDDIGPAAAAPELVAAAIAPSAAATAAAAVAADVVQALDVPAGEVLSSCGFLESASAPSGVGMGEGEAPNIASGVMGGRLVCGIWVVCGVAEAGGHFEAGVAAEVWGSGSVVCEAEGACWLPPPLACPLSAL